MEYDDDMVIKVKRGLDIPLRGVPKGEVKELPLPRHVALDLAPFGQLRFTLLKKEGSLVKVGEPLAEDKGHSGRVFISPASGKVLEIRRGLKKRILSIIIETDSKQSSFQSTPMEIDEIITKGIAPHIQVRPGLRIAKSQQKPDTIFIKGIESAPYSPPPELDLVGNEEWFQEGVKGLGTLAPVHLVYWEGTSHFSQFKGCSLHGAIGPHPVGNPSVHIRAISPITRNDQVVWVLTTHDVIVLGKALSTGDYHTQRIVAVGGEGAADQQRGYFRVNRGVSIEALLQNCSPSQPCRLISGDPLMGVEVDSEGFLGFYHSTLSMIPNQEMKREFLHFLKWKKKGFTASKGYFFRSKRPTFTTHQHGEERAFIDGQIYDRVMPLPIQTMPLIKTLITEEYEKSESLGLLEVAPEDFALAAFVCPSKIDMPGIVKSGLEAYGRQHYEE